MKQKDFKKIMRMHEIALRFNHNKNGANFNASELCHLDSVAIKQLLDEGYKPSEIMKEATKVFKGGKKRYEILKKYIQDFEKKQNDKNNI